MPTQFYTASSLDGFIAGPGDELGWLTRFDIADSSYSDFIRDVGAVAMGSSTYEWLLANNLDADGKPAPWPYAQPTWVFTTRDLPILDGDVRFVRGDVRPVHAEMVAAAGDKNVWIVGGGDLAGQFHDAGLLDQLIIQIAPVTLGKGKPLFPREITEPAMELVSATPYGPFVEVRYRVPRPA